MSLKTIELIASMTGGNTSDWHATSMIRPDYILVDMVKLLHWKLLPDLQLFFMDVFR